jgi:6-phosphofructokinase 1
MKKLGILTGGGDVPGLNAVIHAAQEKAISLNISLIGFLKGWEGILKNEFIDLTQSSVDPAIGGTVLKSSRLNINKIKDGPEIALNNLAKNHLNGLIVMGGEDALSNAFFLKGFPQALIAKTIDNDVGHINLDQGKLDWTCITNYFTIGFPTAAEKISTFVSLKDGLRTTAYSHERIIIIESMGMHAGWLALSSAMGEPDFILIPEFPIDYEYLLEKIISRYKEQKHLIIVISEGARWKDGTHVHAVKDEIEEFEHPCFGGAAEALKKRLKEDLSQYFPTRNINAVNPSYLYRSGAPNALDRKWASKLGEMSVRVLTEGANRSFFLSIQKKESDFHIVDIPLSKFHSIQDLHRFVDTRFYDEHEFQISEIGRDYLAPIIPKIPSNEAYGKFPNK